MPGFSRERTISLPGLGISNCFAGLIDGGIGIDFGIGFGLKFGMSNLWSVITLRSGSLNWYLGSGIWIGLKSNFGGTYGSADP